MAKAPVKNEVAVVEPKRSDVIPAHLQAKKTVKSGNLDSSDLIIPRIKLLQAISPEVTEMESAKAGRFWHTLAEEELGTSFDFIPIIFRKTFTLWTPRGDDRGILARANDGIHWDVLDDFDVKLKGFGNVTWSTKAGTVEASGLAKFGSSNPNDRNSNPAASVNYEILAYLPEHPELSPVIILNTRSAVKAAKNLYSKMELRPVDHYYQRFTAMVTQEQGDEGPYFNYKYAANGYADEEEAQITKSMFERFSATQFRANDEQGDDDGASSGSTGGDIGGKSGKF